MLRRKIKYKLSSIGKYIDTPTKATLNVVYYLGDVGDFKLSVGDLKDVFVKGCRFQIKYNEAKKKKKFFANLSSFLSFSSDWDYSVPKRTSYEVPLLFGLLKLRKNKERRFILIQSADCFRDNKVINIIGVTIDNLLYLELIARSKLAVYKKS
jgi:hypothetical protein